MNTRRSFLHRVLAFGASALSLQTLAGAESSQDSSGPRSTAHSDTNRRHPAGPPVSVVTPDIPSLGYTRDGSVKVFHLVAEPVKQQIAPDKVLDLWGFNGSAPGPTIQVNQGDRVRIVVDNHLPEPTSMHWHGFEIPIDMDGMPGVSQELIKPGGRFTYEFTLHQEGTYFYHSHMAMQEMMGMLGGFIMHPKQPYRPAVGTDFLIALQEHAVLPSKVSGLLMGRWSSLWILPTGIAFTTFPNQWGRMLKFSMCVNSSRIAGSTAWDCGEQFSETDWVSMLPRANGRARVASPSRFCQ